jgi:hypothetical protein
MAVISSFGLLFPYCEGEGRVGRGGKRKNVEVDQNNNLDNA